MPNAPYRIYAVRYAHRKCTTSEAFYGDYHKGPMTMDYFVWALTNGAETVVVDLGFTEAVGTRRGRQFLRDPGKGLAEIGVEAASVKHVILSHFHYDHVGNYALFPNATFYVQDSEMAFYTGRHAALPAFRHSVEVDDVCALIRLNYDRRMQFVDGSREIVPGIAVHHVGGHTAGMQIVTVAHARGQAVVASDASHYYRNFEEGIPFNTLQDLPRMYSAFAKLRELASSQDLVLPGHDPLVLERLKRVGDGIVEM
ncbi:MAG TPA: N-acyl homoserine lactonase family protein [Methylomirabilota bacterium]|jgi:glyoxylase-like metal-dependent hydrolase (beta-lactamase superfamily II)|nr:N-acyl homoserine lactonase family protein [Methylomirabilota bacterium]